MSESTTATTLRLSDFDYPLPRHLVAKYPLKQRDASRMMIVDRNTRQVSHASFNHLLDYLTPGDRIVINNTQVLPSRLLGNRRGHSGKVEILLLYPTGDDTHAWHALMRPARKLAVGTVVELPGTGATVEIIAREDRGRGQVRLHLNADETVETFMHSHGHMPLPPYLEREAEPEDNETYQTVYAKVPGAQAAPTAGLHFTPPMMQQLRDAGIQISELTLSVSSGTFRDVASDNITEHRMDAEEYHLDEETAGQIQETRNRGSRIIAIGTTVAKTLETVAQNNGGRICAERGWSELFIYPGFEFQVTDGLLTNFHLPKTTLLMLVSAFASRELILSAYHQAVSEEYRFFSYGDCMLIL